MTKPPLTLIGLMGRSGAGKDTVAEHLRRAHGFEPMALAAPIKDMLEPLLITAGADYAHLHEPDLKNTPMPELGGRCARQLMTSLGDWGRAQDPLFWISAVERSLGLHDGMPVHHQIVISDVRYPNEAAWVHRHGGHIWLVLRDELPLVHQHASETSHQGVTPDVVLDNNRSIQHLQADVTAALARVPLRVQLARALETSALWHQEP